MIKYLDHIILKFALFVSELYLFFTSVCYDALNKRLISIFLYDLSDRLQMFYEWSRK